MRHCATHRCPFNCVVPEYMQRNLALNLPDLEAREKVLAALARDETFRTSRAGTLDSRRSVSQARRAARRAERLSAWLSLATSEGVKERNIFDANNTERLPGTLVRGEGDPPVSGQDGLAINEAYDGLGATYDFYWENFERDSIDDDGMTMNATVHFGRDYNNAFWDGQRMIFGDGDGELFNRFTVSLDVIGHELTHGVTEEESGLFYVGQSGALNEHISDVFGSLIKQYLRGDDVDEADWLIGEGLLTDEVDGVALRSMKDPGSAYDDPVLGKDPQPKNMKDYVYTFEDNGGVHINSGIPNYAFYLAADKLGGFAWETVGPIWYDTLLRPQLRRTTNFSRFATLTIISARELYPGPNSPEPQAVIEAWKEVDVLD